MKKFLLLAAVAGCLAFAGCDKDDLNAPDSLVGTVWENIEQEDGKTVCYDIIEFKESTFAWIGWEGNISNAQASTGKYTYNPPVVVLIEKYGSSKGRVNGKTMIIGEKKYTLKE